MSDIPQVIIHRLQELDPGASFTGQLPRIKSSSGSLYFVKLGSPSEKEQYVGEVESLRAIYNAAPGLAPRILAFEILDSGAPFFVSEYKDLSSLSSNAAGALAERMAKELHSGKSAPGKGFGFEVPTHCGATRITNGWFEHWDECFASMIGNLLSQLERKGRYKDLCRKGRIIQTRVIPKLLGPLEIHPVILHGDLWSGNVGMDKTTGKPIIYDPASYYGHNEADLSIARIFGGFPEKFFEKYHECLPKSEPVDQYSLRMDLYELFHYLNHTLIFGGHYAGSADNKMDRLITALLNN